MLANFLFLISQMVTVLPMTEGRFEVSTTIKGSSPSAHANAQIALMQVAQKTCKGRGRAISAGTLILGVTEPDSKGKTRLKISEVYSCERPPA